MIPARVWMAAHYWAALLFLVTGCSIASPLPAAGIRPLPLLMGGWIRDPITRKVDSLQPTLQWETFPRPEDLKADTDGRLADARSVTYEIRVWRADDGSPGELAYARTGLAEPAHTFDTPLAPDTLYLWTIRARFDLDGQPRVTQWAILLLVRADGRPPDARRTVLPPSGYYELRTPKRADARGS